MTFQYGPVIKLPLQILPSQMANHMGWINLQRSLQIDQSDNFDNFFGNFINGPYWNAYPMT